MVLERSVKPSDLKKLQDDYSVDMAREGIEERRRGLMVIKKSSLPSKADKRKTAILNWQVRLGLQFSMLCARLRIERSGFELRPGKLFCVLGQETLLSQCLSPSRCINGYRRV